MQIKKNFGGKSSQIKNNFFKLKNATFSMY